MPRIPHTFGGFVTSFVTLRHWHLAPSQINPVNTVPSYFFKAHFNTALPSTSRSSWWSLCFRFYDITFLHIAHFSRACNMLCPPHLPTLDGLNSICRTLSIVKLITILCYVPPLPSNLCSKYSLQLLLSSLFVESDSWSVNSPALHTTQRFAFLFTSASRIQSTATLTHRRLMSYTYGAPILDVSRSHTTTQHSR